MVIAISATEGNMNATVDPRFGRAAWFLLVDPGSGQLIEAISNSAGQEAAHGAGISAAALVADKGVQAVLTGRVGPKAMAVLDKAGVRAINDISGSVMDAVANFASSVSSGTATANRASSGAGTQGPNFGGGQGNCRGGGRGKGQGQGQGQGRGKCRS